MRPVRIPRPFPHVESESLLLLTSPRALEVNCRSTCSLSTCPALSHVSFLSFENPAPRETSVVSVCSSDQGTTHQPDSLTRGSTASSTVLLLQESTSTSYLHGASGQRLLGDLGRNRHAEKLAQILIL